ncbi:chemotaxis protein CheW [bacterium]|nr:chemotaxis protein CheW [bacterium]
MEPTAPLFLFGDTPEEVEDARALIVLELAGERFAVELTDVSEVIRDYPLYPVPGAPEFVDGVVNLRGRVVTVLSGRRLLGLADDPPPTGERILILQGPGELLGVRVDRVVGVKRVAVSALEPPLAGKAGDARGALRGLFTSEDRAVSLLDLAKLVTAPLESAAGPELRAGFAVDKPQSGP